MTDNAPTELSAQKISWLKGCCSRDDEVQIVQAGSGSTKLLILRVFKNKGDWYKNHKLWEVTGDPSAEKLLIRAHLESRGITVLNAKIPTQPPKG